MEEFTTETALTTGSWDRRFTRILATATAGRAAVALIDSNGADRPSGWEEIEFYAWDEEGGWSWTTSGSAGSSGWSSPGIVYACGQSSANTVVVSFQAQKHEVPVGDDGWWLFAAQGEPTDEAPIVVG